MINETQIKEAEDRLDAAILALNEQLGGIGFTRNPRPNGVTPEAYLMSLCRSISIVNLTVAKEIQ